MGTCRKIDLFYMWDTIVSIYCFASLPPVLRVLVCLWGMSLSLELLGGSLQLLEYVFELYSSYPRRSSSSDHLPFVPYSWDFKLEFQISICSSSDHRTSSDKAQGPMYDPGPLTLHLLRYNLTCLHIAFKWVAPNWHGECYMHDK